MIKTAVERMAIVIGNDIGRSDNLVQADLLNGFCEGLANSADENKLSLQICAFVDSLNPKAHRVLKETVEFIKLKEND